MEVHRDRWAARIADPSLSASQHAYATKRYARLSGHYRDRERSCARVGVEVKCECPGKRSVRWYTCRQHLTCVRCRVERSKKLTAKIRSALADRWERAPANQLLVMMTIALRHTGDVSADRRELALAWERFRKAVHKRFGKFSFVGTYEVTPGGDSLGHVHAHVVCMWPRGAPGSGEHGDWSLLRTLWVESAGLGPDGVERSTRCSFVASGSPKHAAGYVAKYVAKGVTTSGFDSVLAAKVVSATYNKRWVFTSWRFWLPFAPVCRCCGWPVVRATFNFQHAANPLPWTRDGPPREQLALALVRPGAPGALHDAATG